MPKTKGLRLDLNPETEPDILGNVYDVAALVGDRRFRLACADPPYTETDNAKYGQKGGINRARATRALASVVVPRGFMTWLDTRAPIYRGDQWRIVLRIYLDRSTGHAIRRLAIFERVASFVTAGDSDNPTRALNTHGQTETCLEHGSQLSSAKGHGGISPQASGPRDQEAERPAVTNLDCARHRHGQMVDGEPEIEEACVNVPYFCARCGVQGGHVSWTRAAWDEHVAKQAARQARRRTA